MLVEKTIDNTTNYHGTDLNDEDLTSYWHQSTAEPKSHDAGPSSEGEVEGLARVKFGLNARNG